MYLGLPGLGIGRTPRGGGGSAWTPASVTSASLALWLDPSDAASITIDTGQIAQINDKSGHARHFSQTSVPQRPSVGALNGRGCISFAALNTQCLVGPAFSLAAAEAFIVNRYNSATVNGGLWRFGTAGSVTVHPFSNGLYYDEYGTDTRKDAIVPTVISTSQHVWNVISTATEWTGIEDGTQVYTTGSNTVGWAATSYIGTSNGLSIYWDGDIGEVVKYDAKLSASDRALVLAYLKAKWGTP